MKTIETLELNLKYLKKLAFILLFLTTLTSCSITIPLLTNLNEQTLLLAENRNIKANYTLVSNVPDGDIPFVAVLKNGTVNENTTKHIYASETAFKKIWKSYLSSKFNDYSKNEMDVIVTLKDIRLKQINSTSFGEVLVGDLKMNVDAVALIDVIVDYKGEKYDKQFEVLSSEYNQTGTRKIGNSSFTVNSSNPTQQKAKLLENCLNRSVVLFENFLSSIMMSAEETE